MKKIVPHTPGPWRQGYKRPDRVYRLEKSGDRDIKVAQTIVHADARLIAAAPELLEALEALNATIDAFWNDPSQSKSRPSERHMKAITLAQVESYKAVVKATGET